MPSNHDIDSADIWLSALRAAGHSPKTLETYGHAVRQLRDWWQSNQDLSTLTKLEARAFVRHLQETYTPGGTRVRVRSLRALFGWLIGEALVTDNPFANLRLTVADTPQRTATDAEIEAMLDHARKASSRDYALLCVLVDTGCRRGEVANVEMADLNLGGVQPMTSARH